MPGRPETIENIRKSKEINTWTPQAHRPQNPKTPKIWELNMNI